jgi:hypothetical protein
MTNQTRLNAVLERQKKGLVIDSLLAAALVVAIGVAVIALWLGLPSFAPAYASEPQVTSATPTAATATMLEQSEDECNVVQQAC